MAFLNREEFKPPRRKIVVKITFGVDVDLVLLMVKLQVQVKSDTPLKDVEEQGWNNLKTHHIHFVHWRDFESRTVTYRNVQLSVSFSLKKKFFVFFENHTIEEETSSQSSVDANSRIAKITNTVHVKKSLTEKCLKNPKYAIFFKSLGFKDVKYDIFWFKLYISKLQI